MSLYDPKTRVVSDKYYEFTKGYGGMMAGENVIPVDMNGKRVFPTKDSGNLQKAADDIKEFYGLTGDCGFAPESNKTE